MLPDWPCWRPPRAVRLNMHGSLLPRYRGRVPVNWAIVHGEQPRPVPPCTTWSKSPMPATSLLSRRCRSLPDDDGQGSLRQGGVLAAEIALYACLPALIAGTAAPRLPNGCWRKGSILAGASPEDGRIDLQRRSAREIYNLIRAVAPPLPGGLSATLRMTRRAVQLRDAIRAGWMAPAPVRDAGRWRPGLRMQAVKNHQAPLVRWQGHIRLFARRLTVPGSGLLPCGH